MVVASSSVSVDALQVGDWAAVPATLPVVALAFVFHNVVPVVCDALEGDAARVRTALLTGVCCLLCAVWCVLAGVS